MFVRSHVETGVAVWHSGLTKINIESIERIQKQAMKIIFKSQYSSYEDALKLAKFTTLEIRREKLCLKFAKECTRNEKLKDMFPLSFNDHNMDKRHLPSLGSKAFPFIWSLIFPIENMVYRSRSFHIYLICMFRIQGEI